MSKLKLFYAMTAGQGIASTIFLATVPLLGTLTQGFRRGLVWTVLCITELIVLYGVVQAGIEPLIFPSRGRPGAAPLGVF
mgnify:CR=1 FL=1